MSENSSRWIALEPERRPSATIPNLHFMIQVDVKDNLKRARVAAVRAFDSTPISGFSKIIKPVKSQRFSSSLTGCIHSLEAAYLRENSLVYANGEDLERAFGKLEQEVRDGRCLKKNWRALSTNQAVLTYFRCQTLDILKENLDRKQGWSVVKNEELYSVFYDKAVDGRKHCDEPAANETALKRLDETDLVWTALREIEPSLPPYTFSLDKEHSKVVRPELLKYVEPDRIRAFVAILKEQREEHPVEVCFAVFALLGLRPSEAAARRPGDMIPEGSYGYCAVNSRVVNGKIDSRLKTRDSYRTVVLPHWARRMLEQLKPIYPDTIPDTARCALWVKRQLEKVGVVDEDAEDNALRDEIERDSEENNKNTVACYLLRRNFCSVMKNVCGLNDTEADILMGHALPHNVKKNLELNCPDYRSRIAKALEHWVTDPDESLNPALRPIPLEAEKLELVPHRRTRLVNNGFEEMTVRIDVYAEEMGDELRVCVPENAASDFHSSTEKRKLIGGDRRVFCEEAY